MLRRLLLAAAAILVMHAPAGAQSKPPAKKPNTATPVKKAPTKATTASKAKADSAAAKAKADSALATAKADSVAKAKAAADAKAKSTTGTTTAKPATRATTTAAKPAPRIVPVPPNEQSVGLYAGGASAGLNFGVGPVGGAVIRWRPRGWAFGIRVDGYVGHFSNTPSAAVGGGSASLNHLGAAAGIEIPLAQPTASVRPYISGTVGVYRFQASGPAPGLNGVTNGVFASTTDVGGAVGVGVRFARRFFAEGRYLNVGDFSTIPFVVGVTF